MNNWLPSIAPFLIENNYQEIINIYEQEIENNPDIVSNYLYLGLAYLLTGEKEQCQSIWFSIFFELDENDTQKYQQELLNILLDEAQRQEKLSNFSLSLLIREQIEEIDNNDLENLIAICLLKSQLNILTVDIVEQSNILQIIELRKNKFSPSEIELIIKLLDIILEFPTYFTINFVKSVYPFLSSSEEFNNLLLSKIDLMAEQKRFLFYGAQLLELTLLSQCNLNILGKIFYYYLEAGQFEHAERIALRYKDNSSTLIENVFAYYQILSNQITMGGWKDIAKNTILLKESVESLIRKKPSIDDEFFKTRLISIGQIFLYIADEPEENKKIINCIGEIYQKQISVDYNQQNISVSLNSHKKNTDRKLKIGYIGHTFKSHSVGFLSRWLINYHDRNKFQIHTYFVNQKEDHITQKFFQGSNIQVYKGNGDVKEYVNQIIEDEIDILVDLDSFTNYLTAMIMSLKPAPIQVSWLGMDSNGLPTIDYFIADPYVLPDSSRKYYREKIWRLPNTYLAVDGFEWDLANISRQSLGIPENAIIYLNIQNAWKRNPENIKAQLKIIKAVENSYLVIKSNGDRNPSLVKELFINIAESEGIEINRLRFLPTTPTEAVHRANLKIADVVLDTYPYNGATTTLETLWMEIPLVTRVGQQFAARNSYTFMMNAGIIEGIAWSDEEYIEWGIKLGTEENLRKEVTWKLKQSKKISPLWKGKQFAREMEKAYQQMWEIYVENNC